MCLQWQIIPLLTQAVYHLKSYGCERMMTSLKVLTADEYYHVKDYDKSYVYVAFLAAHAVNNDLIT